MAGQKRRGGEGATRAASGRADALDPSTPLTLREAAVLAGVDESSLARLCDEGALLFEIDKRGRKEVRCVRLRDLAEVYPGVLGRRPRPVVAAEVTGGPAAEQTPADLQQLTATDSSVADAVRASGTTRDALIELCQDLETRLDLADRERQASTASLLMAQRRVLDLELQSRPRPWARVSGALLGLLSVTAMVLVVRLPGTLREASVERAAEVRAALSVDLEGMRAEIESVTARDEAARQSFADRIETSEQVISGGQRAFEVLAREARQEREATTDERVRVKSALDGLEERLATAEKEAQRRAVELGLMIDASSRDRARFAERLVAAERVAEDARVQLATERRSSADERATFERRLGELARAAEEYDEDHASELRALRDAVEAAAQSVPEVATPAESDSWISRSLRAMLGQSAEPIENR